MDYGIASQLVEGLYVMLECNHIFLGIKVSKQYCRFILQYINEVYADKGVTVWFGSIFSPEIIDENNKFY